MALGEHVHVYLYIPFFSVLSGLVLLRLHSMSLSLVAEVKVVLMPALASDRLI